MIPVVKLRKIGKNLKRFAKTVFSKLINRPGGKFLEPSYMARKGIQLQFCFQNFELSWRNRLAEIAETFTNAGDVTFWRKKTRRKQ